MNVKFVSALALVFFLGLASGCSAHVGHTHDCECFSFRMLNLTGVTVEVRHDSPDGFVYVATLLPGEETRVVVKDVFVCFMIEAVDTRTGVVVDQETVLVDFFWNIM